MKTRLIVPLCCLFCLWALTAHAPRARAAEPDVRTSTTQLDRTQAQLGESLLDYYEDTTAAIPRDRIELPAFLNAEQSNAIRERLSDPAVPFPLAVGTTRARLQHAVLVKMLDAIRAGRIDDAKRWRSELILPRGVSAAEGALLLETLAANPKKRDEAAKLLACESITFFNTRVRQLLDESDRSLQHSLPMPGRLLERLGEATTLADLPAELRATADINRDPKVATISASDISGVTSFLGGISEPAWANLRQSFAPVRRSIEVSLPALLTATERQRRERLMLKLVMLVPKEYAAGVRDGQVVVPLEYREAVTFTSQARQMLGELAPLWLNENDAHRASVEKLETLLSHADEQIAAKQDETAIERIFGDARKVMESDLSITLRRSGTTADIVDEVMLETRSLLTQSFAAALKGQWSEAERLRLEAYTTYDPELEARLMPRDPQLATDIEHLLLDGLEKPGVKALLDKRAGKEDLEVAYARVTEGLGKAGALLKGGIDPTAAAINAGSIVLREGLEGLLVLIAIFAGLRGEENAHRRRWMWVGILASVAATAVTWVLSQTILTSLRAYGEFIAAVTGIVAIAILLLITNWLFHQIYWQQWVRTLKSKCTEGESIWHLITVGFAIGYREGFETVLFIQSLLLDAGTGPIVSGVAVGSIILLAMGFAALYIGMKLPYFKLLMFTAMLIGVVLLTFVGGTVRAMQTVSWLPVNKIADASWPAWMGTWLGIYNTWETILAQIGTVVLVIGTWRLERWKAHRENVRKRARRIELQQAGKLTVAPDHECNRPLCPEAESCELADSIEAHNSESLTPDVRVPKARAPQPMENEHIAHLPV